MNKAPPKLPAQAEANLKMLFDDLADTYMAILLEISKQFPPSEKDANPKVMASLLGSPVCQQVMEVANQKFACSAEDWVSIRKNIPNGLHNGVAMMQRSQTIQRMVSQLEMLKSMVGIAQDAPLLSALDKALDTLPELAFASTVAKYSA